jgi:RNA polymerase sigma factor (sigma-70 family)
MDSTDALDDLDPAFPFERLLHALRAGDGAAWSDVFERLLPRATSAIRRSFGSTIARSENAGGEAVASACRSIYRNLREGKFELENWDDLTGLFIRIAIHKCIDRLRAERRLVTMTDLGQALDSDNAALEPLDPARSPSDELLRTEALKEFRRVVDLVRRRLNRRNEKWRAIFNLRLEGTYTIAEIARVVGCTQHSVKRVWHEAVEMVKQLYRGSLPDETKP